MAMELDLLDAILTKKKKKDVKIQVLVGAGQ